MRRIIWVALGISIAPEAFANPRELGDVEWLRNFDQAQAQSKKSGKPILILFDEVPGCATCQHYGDLVMKHPLVVEAAESLFVPLAIYNNLGGHDRRVLRSFQEPSWNNPVVRVIGPDRRALAPRLAGDYSVFGLVKTMITALQEGKRPVPDYLRLLADEATTEKRGQDRAVFAMHCFWSGEACLGGIEGVVATRTGFLGGREVVEVTFDPTRLPYETLVLSAQKAKCTSHVFARNPNQLAIAKKMTGLVTMNTGWVRASQKDDKYQLKHTPWRYVPMTALQASRANTFVGRGRDPSKLFSSRQLAIYRSVIRHPNREWKATIGKDFREAFARAEKRASS